MCRRSAAPTSAGTGTTGTPAIRQPVIASTVGAVGVASTATRCAPPTRSATDVAAPTRSLRLSTSPSMRTASAMSVALTADGFSEASSTSVPLVPELHQRAQDLLAAAQPGEMALLRQVEQLGVGQPGHDVLAVGERDDVVVVAVPPADRDLHLVAAGIPSRGRTG